MQNSDFDPLISRELAPVFWTPERLGCPSAWWGHVPFAFWLVAKCEPRLLVELGTHRGVSYAAFCEAVARLRLGTRCYAVDTWEGDSHAGAYDEEVYTELKEFHDRRYGSFSQLVRKTFDDACGDFADASIDLLHIDGVHTYGAVRHDFETWRPKLSARAVVLFHDSNERQRDFGVWRFLEELKQEAPVFEFLHAHGLAVVAVGTDVPEMVARLCRLREEAEIVALRERFSLFGARWMAEQEKSNLLEHSRALDADLHSSLVTAREQNDELGHRVQRLKQDLYESRQDNSALQQNNEDIVRRLQQNNEDIVWRLAVLRLNEFDGRLPRQLKGWRWLSPGRWKKLRRLTRDYRVIASSPLFDRPWYLAMNPDVVVNSEDPVLHYLLYGAGQGRAPGPHFDGSRYLEANPDLAALRVNPLVHYIRHGRNENRRIWSAKDGRAPVSRRSDGVGEDPLAIPSLLDELNKKHAAAVHSGTGLQGHERYRTINLEEWRDEITLTDATSVLLSRPIGVFVHLFYEDLAEEVAAYLTCIDLPKRIYISTNSQEKCSRIAAAFERSGLGSVSEFAIASNSGYDIAPMLIQFREKLSNHDICLKIHGKKSVSGRVEFGERWRKFLYQDLIGDSERVRAIVSTILSSPDLGILMARHFYGAETFINIGPNYGPMQKILAEIGIGLDRDQKIEFPSASMFWFRSEALAKLAELSLDWTDFDSDSRKKDGTLAHGIERCFLFFCAGAGKRWGFLPAYPTGQKLSRDDVVRLIRASGAFDEVFYKAAYPDVRGAGVDPVEHWVDFGAREARDPSNPRLPNPEVYELLERHLRGLPLAGRAKS